MKVIGNTQNGYVCEVNHSEIEQFLGLYYNKKSKLKIGEEVDLGAGYNWESKIASALRQTQEFVKETRPIIQNMMEGYSILANLSKE